MKLQQETNDIQEKLGSYCRTGTETELPGVYNDKLHHYRRLVYNAVKNTMVQAYPITYQVLEEKGFDPIVRKFFAENPCKTPQIWKLPGEFYEWAVTSGISGELQLPWLDDLLLFEWIELDIHTMEDMEIPMANEITNLFTDHLVFNPEFKLIRLNYPVHLFNVKEAAKRRSSYFVMVSRHPDSGKVFFFNLSFIHVWVIEKLSVERISLEDLIPQIHQNFGIENEIILRNNLRAIFSDLVRKKVVLGSIPKQY